MEHDKNPEQENNKESTSKGATHWIDKAEAMIDDASEKIHQSDAYREAGKAMEQATKKMFRKAGRWWGKSEQYFKNKK